GDEAVLRGADREPGGQALNVGGKEILSGDGDAHLEDRPHQDVVRGLAARSVGRGDVDREVVDDTLPAGTGLCGSFLFQDDAQGLSLRPLPYGHFETGIITKRG